MLPQAHMPCTTEVETATFRESGRVVAAAFRAVAWIAPLLLAGALADGCARSLKPVDLSSAGPRLRNVTEGVTARQEIVRRLGRPAATFEDDSIAVWFLDKNQKPLKQDGEKTRFHLVAVSDPQGVVQRLSLLRVR